MIDFSNFPQRPFRVEIEITNKCNLNCTYCYLRDELNKGHEPTLDEINYMLKWTKEQIQPFEVVLLGGEPFIRSDIIKIFELSAKYFSNIGVSSNGTLIYKLSKNDMLKLKNLSNKVILQVSIDSIYRDVNNKTRGMLVHVMKSLEHLNKYDIPIYIGMVMTKINKHTIIKTIEYLLNNYDNIIGINLMSLIPSVSMCKSYYYKYRLTYNEIKHIITSINNMGYNKIRIFHPLEFESAPKSTLDKLNFPLCFAGITKITIKTNGDVIPCSMLRKIIMGNIYKNTWPDMRENWINKLSSFIKSNLKGGLCYIFNLKAC